MGQSGEQEQSYKHALMAKAIESAVEFTKIKISGVGDMAHWTIMFIA